MRAIRVFQYKFNVSFANEGICVCVCVFVCACLCVCVCVFVNPHCDLTRQYHVVSESEMEREREQISGLYAAVDPQRRKDLISLRPNGSW